MTTSSISLTIDELANLADAYECLESFSLESHDCYRAGSIMNELNTRFTHLVKVMRDFEEQGSFKKGFAKAH